MSAFDQIEQAIAEAREAKQAVRKNSDRMASLLVGELDSLSSWHLRQLKRELARYNMHTGRWSRK